MGQLAESVGASPRIAVHEEVNVMAGRSAGNDVVDINIPGVALIRHIDMNQIYSGVILCIGLDDLLGIIGASVGQNEYLQLSARLCRVNAVEAGNNMSGLVVGKH